MVLRYLSYVKVHNKKKIEPFITVICECLTNVNTVEKYQELQSENLFTGNKYFAAGQRTRIEEILVQFPDMPQLLAFIITNNSICVALIEVTEFLCCLIHTK